MKKNQKKGYSFSLLINQVPVVELGYDEIDIIDMAIYEEIVKIMGMKGTVIMRTLEGDWWWISHSLLLSRLPLLRINSKPTLIRRNNMLIERDMVERYGNKGTQKTFYRLTEFHDKYLTYTPNNFDTPLSNLREGSIKNETPPLSNLKDNDIIKEDIKTKEVSLSQKSFKKWTEKEFVQIIDENKKNYPRTELIKFYNYWAEKNPKGKMRFQLQATWETDRRLVTWMAKVVVSNKSKAQADGFQSIIDGQ